MTDDELERRHEALRRAAVAVLESTAATATAVSPAHQRKLDALEQALTGPGSPDAAAREIVDPSRHLVHRLDYRSGVPGGTPFSLAAEARSIRRSLAEDDVAEHPRGYHPDDWRPTLTEPQATVVATLLQELAARLVATGDPGGRELATVALELADSITSELAVSDDDP